MTRVLDVRHRQLRLALPGWVPHAAQLTEVADDEILARSWVMPSRQGVRERTGSARPQRAPLHFSPNPSLSGGTVITVSRTVTVASAIDRVAPYLSDFTTTAQWDPHTAECTRLDDGPVREGSTFRNVQRLGPLRPRFTYRVVRFDPERAIVLHARTPALDATDTMEFEEVEGPRGLRQTVVTYTASFRLKGVARVLKPVLERLLGRLADDGAAGMQQTLATTLRH